MRKIGRNVSNIRKRLFRLGTNKKYALLDTVFHDDLELSDGVRGEVQGAMPTYIWLESPPPPKVCDEFLSG